MVNHRVHPTCKDIRGARTREAKNTGVEFLRRRDHQCSWDNQGIPPGGNKHNLMLHSLKMTAFQNSAKPTISFMAKRNEALAMCPESHREVTSKPEVREQAF